MKIFWALVPALLAGSATAARAQPLVLGGTIVTASGVIDDGLIAIGGGNSTPSAREPLARCRSRPAASSFPA